MRASANLDKINFKKDKIFLVLKFHFLEARAALANHGEERGVCRALKVTGKTRQGNVRTRKTVFKGVQERATKMDKNYKLQ